LKDGRPAALMHPEDAERINIGNLEDDFEQLSEMMDSNKISEYDAYLGMRIAAVLSGGDYKTIIRFQGALTSFLTTKSRK
jgi:hypothetical protein